MISRVGGEIPYLKRTSTAEKSAGNGEWRMKVSAVYRTEGCKCAICRWWNGERGIDFRANGSFYGNEGKRKQQTI